MTDQPVLPQIDSTINPDTIPIGEALSLGSGDAGVPAAWYVIRNTTPRGVLAMELINTLRERESHERQVAEAKALIKNAKSVAAEDDDRVGALLEALRKLDKGTPLEDTE